MSSPEKLAPVSNLLKYAGFATAAGLLPRLPAIVGYSLSVTVADFARVVTPGRRRNVADNLRHILGDHATGKCIEAETRAVYHNVARYYVDLMRLPALDVQRLERAEVVIQGYEHLTKALVEGHGVIVATAHYGSPELALMAASARGLSFFVLTEPLEPPQLSQLYIQLRSRHGHRLMPVSLQAIKEAVRSLRRGGAVVLLIDRDIQGTGIEVPFFGALARVPTGAVELARRTHAPIVPIFAFHTRDGGVQVVVEPPLPLVSTGDRERDLRTNLERLLKRLERQLSEDPSQWLVLERIWREPARPSAACSPEASRPSSGPRRPERA